MPRMRWRPGLRPGPAGGALDAPPDPLVGWGGGLSRYYWTVDNANQPRFTGRSYHLA